MMARLYCCSSSHRLVLWLHYALLWYASGYLFYWSHFASITFMPSFYCLWKKRRHTSLATFWLYFFLDLLSISQHFHQILFDPLLIFWLVLAVVCGLLPPLLEHIDPHRGLMALALSLGLFSVRWIWRGPLLMLNLSIFLLIPQPTSGFNHNLPPYVGSFCCSTATILLACCTWCLDPTSRGISIFRQLIICCLILKLIQWAIIKSTPIITSSTVSALMMAIVTFASIFPWMVADSQVAGLHC